MPNLTLERTVRNQPFQESAITKSTYVQSDVIPEARSDLKVSMGSSDKKILKEFQQIQADKKHYEKTLVSFDDKSTTIDSTELRPVEETIEFFERLKGQQQTPEQLTSKKLSVKLPSPMGMGQPLQIAKMKATNDSAVSDKALVVAKALPTQPTKASILDAVNDFFQEWIVQPFKKLFGLEDAPKIAELEISPYRRMAETRHAEFLEKFEKELEKMQERITEEVAKSKDVKSQEVFLRLQWIRLVKMMIEYQEEQMKAISDMVMHQQMKMQDRQKETTRMNDSLSDTEDRMKPMAWIGDTASTVRLVAGSISGAMFVASCAITAMTGGFGAVPMAAIAGIGAFSSVVGSIANAADGFATIRKGSLQYDFDQLIGKLQSWQHEDDCISTAIEEEMNDLALKLDVVQKLWDDLIQNAKRTDQVMSKTHR